jgi:dolichyl-phosphate beta-glucosyltransferase
MTQQSKEERPYLSIVIPAYNESKRIGETLKHMKEFLVEKPYSWEIVLVDDGSNDSTIQVAQEQITDSRLRIIVNPRNLGKGASIRNGMLEAKGEYLLFSDADLSTPIEELDRLLNHCQKGYGVAIGSRALKESQLVLRQAWYREFMGRVFNIMVRLIVLGGIRDTQCGFKMFTRRAAMAIFPKQKLKGFAFDVELLLLARKAGYRIKEVPVRWINSPSSKVSALRDSLKMFMDLIRIRLGI